MPAKNATPPKKQSQNEVKPVEQLMQEQYEELKLQAARTIYKKQDEYVPGKGIRWYQWWQDKFNENYREYTERKMREKDEA